MYFGVGQIADSKRWTWLGHVPPAIQALFYAVGIVLAILTYLQARKSFFQPLRTEVFKLQLRSVEDTLQLFAGKSETELREYFGLDMIVKANVYSILDAYASSCFGLKADADRRPYSRAECPGARVHPRALELADDYTIDGETAKRDLIVDPSSWVGKYHHDVVPIHKNFFAAEREVRNALSNPILPKQCELLLESLMDTVNESISDVAKVLEVAAREFPAKYPNRESFMKASPDWLSIRCTRQIKSLEPKVDELASYVRQYFDVDELYNGPSKPSN